MIGGVSLNDITAILIGYADQVTLHKAFMSLNPLRSRLKSVIVFQQTKGAFQRVTDIDWSDRIRTILVQNQDEGDLLQKTIHSIDTPYVLWLSGNDYLSSKITPHSFQLSGNQSVLGTFKHNQDMTIRQPLLVRTSLLKQHPLLSSTPLPFKEALFPAWLSRVENLATSFKEGLVKDARKNNAKN